MIIDSHQHFWNFNSEKNTWITDEMNVLKKNFYPNDLITELKKNKVAECDYHKHIDSNLNKIREILDKDYFLKFLHLQSFC